MQDKVRPALNFKQPVSKNDFTVSLDYSGRNKKERKKEKKYIYILIHQQEISSSPHGTRWTNGNLIVCWGKQQAVTAYCTITNGGWFHLSYVRTPLTRVKLPCSTLNSVRRDLMSLVVASYTDNLFHNIHSSVKGTKEKVTAN